MKMKKYILKTESGLFVGSPTDTLTPNINLAAVFTFLGNQAAEFASAAAARYERRFGKMTPIELIPKGGSPLFPKYE